MRPGSRTTGAGLLLAGLGVAIGSQAVLGPCTDERGLAALLLVALGTLVGLVGLLRLVVGRGPGDDPDPGA